MVRSLRNQVKVLSRSGGSNAGEMLSSLKRPREVHTKGPECHPVDVVGVYLELSQELLCPGDMTHRLPDALRKNLFLILTEHPVSVSKRRLQALRQVDELAASLEDEEVRVRAGVDSDVQESPVGRNFLLVGEEPPLPLFAKRPRPMAISPCDLVAQAALRRDSLKRVRGLMDLGDLEARDRDGA